LHAASAPGLFSTQWGVCGIFRSYQLPTCLMGTPAPCQKAAYQVRPPIWASQGTGHNARARGGTARCEVVEGCRTVPSKIVRAHITVCGRGRVSKTLALTWLARILAGGGTRKFPVSVLFAKIRPAGAERGAKPSGFSSIAMWCWSTQFRNISLFACEYSHYL
jgi:hypothetical protein